MNCFASTILIFSLTSAVFTTDIDGTLWGAIAAKPGQFPWIVNIHADSELCVGTLIDSQWVLTTATCALDKDVFRLRFGTPSLSLEDPTRVQIVSRESYAHPSFEQSYRWHDIGLIKLSTPIEFNDYIKPIKLYNREPLGTNVKLTLYGWGQAADDNGLPSLFLHYGDTVTIDNQVCDDLIGGVNKESICSKDGVVTCYTGDEASPGTISDENGDPILAAIYTTYIDPVFCSSPQKAPIRLARIEPYLPWIAEMTGLEY